MILLVRLGASWALISCTSLVEAAGGQCPPYEIISFLACNFNNKQVVQDRGLLSRAIAHHTKLHSNIILSTPHSQPKLLSLTTTRYYLVGEKIRNFFSFGSIIIDKIGNSTMPKLSKNTVLKLTIFSLSCFQVAIFTNPVMAGELILDRNCRYHERTRENFKKIPPQNRATIYFTSGFNAGKKQYVLQVLKLPNSTSVFCLINPQTRTNQRISKIQLIQDKQIEKIEKLSDKQATYIVTAKGNKSENVFRVFYRLNLSNPYEPKLTPLIRIYNKSYTKTNK